MDYYARRTRAFKLVRDLFFKGFSEEEICLNAQTHFGLSSKVINEHIDLLKKIKK